MNHPRKLVSILVSFFTYNDEGNECDPMTSVDRVRKTLTTHPTMNFPVEKVERAPDLEALKRSIDSAAECLKLHTRDWSQSYRDAWLWGVLCGWSEEGLKEIQEKHGFGDEAMERLRILRKPIQDLRGK